MKIIAVTLRVDEHAAYGEKRDALDERWIQFFVDCGFIPLLIPNHTKAVKMLMEHIKVDGVLLTGGNSLVKYGGDAPQRDDMERYLISYAIEKDIPLVGVCRGMQMIQDYFGVVLHPVEGHVAVKHEVLLGKKQKIKNSYHTYAAQENIDNFEVIAKTQDGVIEAVQHYKYEIYAIMWHPERNDPFDKEDITFFKKIFRA